MKKWLREGAEDKIPPFATHQVGCAGFVLNDQNEILVIREWSGPPSNRTATRQWKMPGGMLDMGESFEEAACREVQEETGIPCEFESILTFWHRHELTFGKSDLYFVCMLRPKSLEIDIDPVEVSAARWMSVDEFVKTQDHPLINHVLCNIFHVDSSKEVGNSKRLVPSAEMAKGAVQWPNRPPIPTYTSSSTKR
jgi:mutator protein MutT